MLGGALLVGLHLLGEYGALQILNYPTLTTGILDQYRTSFNGPAATLLALVLVAFCLLLLGLELLARGRRRRSRVGAGVSRTATRTRLGTSAPVVLAGLLGLGVLALGVPLVSLARWLVRGTSTSFPAGDLSAATLTTVGLALAGGLVATIAALPVAWLAVRHRGLFATAIERSVYPANALPGIVVALALVTVSIRSVPVVYQTVPLLVLGYSHPVPAPRGRQRARHAGAGPAGARRRRPVTGLHQPGRGPPGHAAARYCPGWAPAWRWSRSPSAPS